MNIPCIKISWQPLAVAILMAFTTVPVWSASPCRTDAKITPTVQNVPAETINNGVFIPTEITLDGTKSRDAETYLWEQISGPEMTLSNRDAATLTFTAPKVPPEGVTLTFKLTVTGCNNPVQTDSKTTTVNVAYIEQNQPPSASATVNPVTVHEGDLVTLNGSSSTDPDGDVLTYHWAQLPTDDFPDDFKVTLQSDPPGAIATFIAPNIAYPNGASLTFRLTVSDGHLSSSTDQDVAVIWNNDPPSAVVNCPTTVNEGQEITLNGQTSSDPDDGIVGYAWTQTLGLPNADLSQVDLSTPEIHFSAPSLTSTFDKMYFSLTVTDEGGLSDSATCSVIVNDVIPPTISVPPDIQEEATSAEGAKVSFSVTAEDRGVAMDVECDRPSGSQFALGETKVTCSAHDEAGNLATESFWVTVVDTIPPDTHIADKPEPLTNQSTATFSFLGSDLVTATENLTFECQLDDAPFASCTSPVTYSDQSDGWHTLKVRAMDGAGNVDLTPENFTWQVDTTPPTIDAQVYPARPSTQWWNFASGKPWVEFACSDATSGVASCPETHTFDEGKDQSHSGIATDKAGNSATASVSDIDVDLTAPTLTWTSEPAQDYYFGYVPAAPTCTATDALSGPGSCTITGYGTTVGSHTLTATAYDVAGNSTVETRTYTVLAWTLSGFTSPVDMGGVLNTVKGGSTVPLKFTVAAGSTALTDVAIVKQFTAKPVTCPGASAPMAEVEVTTTGGTALRYDAIAGQFIQNWQTPKKPNACYEASIQTADESQLVARFKLK